MKAVVYQKDIGSASNDPRICVRFMGRPETSGGQAVDPFRDVTKRIAHGKEVAALD
jgi:hypothetical protein